MLSAGVTKPQFHNILQMAYRSGASGYLAGRAIWWDAFEHFPDMQTMRADLEGGGIDYMRRINALTEQHAIAWHAHPSYGPDGPRLMAAGPGFRTSYGGIVAP